MTLITNSFRCASSTYKVQFFFLTTTEKKTAVFLHGSIIPTVYKPPICLCLTWTIFPASFCRSIFLLPASCGRKASKSVGVSGARPWRITNVWNPIQLLNSTEPSSLHGGPRKVLLLWRIQTASGYWGTQQLNRSKASLDVWKGSLAV